MCSNTSGRATLAGAVALVAHLVDEVESLVANGAGGGSGEAGAALDWLRVMRRVDGVAALLGARVAAGGDWAVDGFGSVRSWLGARSNAGQVTVGRIVGRSAAFEVCPLLAAAWVAERVDFEHVRVVLDAHRRYPRLSQALKESEPQIVAAACEVDPVVLGHELFQLLHQLDPQAVDDAAEARRRGEVGLHVSRVLDGYVRVDGLLPPEVGHALLSVLEAARQVAPTGDVPAGGVPVTDAGNADSTSSDSTSPDPGSPDPGSPDPAASRSVPADAAPPVGGRVGLRLRNVAALAHMLQVVAGLPGGLPQVAGARPVLTIHVPLESLASGDVPGWVAGLSGGRVVPISASSVQRLSCDGVRRMLVVDQSGMVDAVSAASRTVPARLGMVVRTRDDGVCRFPGCHDPIREVHHVVPWSRGGATVSANLLGVCWHHHHLVHEGGWVVRGDANSEVTFTSAGGRSVVSQVRHRRPPVVIPRRC